jgi:hypothetical protein
VRKGNYMGGKQLVHHDDNVISVRDNAPSRNLWKSKQSHRCTKPSKWWQITCEEKGNHMGVEMLVHEDSNVITKTKL